MSAPAAAAKRFTSAYRRAGLTYLDTLVRARLLLVPAFFVQALGPHVALQAPTATSSAALPAPPPLPPPAPRSPHNAHPLLPPLQASASTALRKVLKEPQRTEAMARSHFRYREFEFHDGKEGNPVEFFTDPVRLLRP